MPFGCAGLDGLTGKNSSDRLKGQGLQPIKMTGERRAKPGPEVISSIARLEAGRHTGGGYLQTLVRHPDPAVRERAARALGRMPLEQYGRSVTGPLELLLRDPKFRVQNAAAFSLGSRGDVSSAKPLMGAFTKADANFRAQLALAMGHIDLPKLRAHLLDALEDEDPMVQGAAAQAIASWPDKGVQESTWSTAQKRLQQVAQDGAEEARWRSLFTLARRKELRQDPSPFLIAIYNPESSTLDRVFSTLGIARLANDRKASTIESESTGGQANLIAALERSAMDTDYRVAVEGLRGLQVLEVNLRESISQHCLQHPSAHVRSAAVQALRPDQQSPEPALMLAKDPSSMVRRSAFTTHISRSPSDAVSKVREWARSRDYRQRRTAAGAAHFLDSDEARGILYGLVEDKHPQVAIQAIEELKNFADDETRSKLRRYCRNEDNGRSLAAVTTLANFSLTTEDLPALIEAYKDAHGDGGVEVCYNAINAAAKIEGKEAVEFLKAGTLHEDEYVVRVAKKELKKLGVGYDSDPNLDNPTPKTRELAPSWSPQQPNPKVAVETNRGTMVFELFPQVAPTHVHNFLTLVDRGYYNNLTWHRVIADFVIQGGCYRGDGNGGGTWRGMSDSLNQEFSELTYAEGALGMPRNENPDSGGSQIFVSVRPTPHLDTRYTLFGMLMSGSESMHKVEEGDRILSIRRLP